MTKETNSTSGVYLIFNKETNQYYIGSSYNIKKRISTHIRLLETNKHHNPKLQRSYNKYGNKMFIYVILEFCDLSVMLNRENFYLKIYQPFYNIAKDAKSPMKGRKHKKSTRKLFSELHKGNTYCLGFKPTEETKEKQRLRKLGSKRPEKTKKKMSETAKRINSISRIDREKAKRKIKDSIGNIFTSLAECAKYWKLSPATICDVLKGRSFATSKNIQFKYIEDTTLFEKVLPMTFRKGSEKIDFYDRLFLKHLHSEGYTFKELSDIFGFACRTGAHRQLAKLKKEIKFYENA